MGVHVAAKGLEHSLCGDTLLDLARARRFLSGPQVAVILATPALH